jgi:hypothetical protein
MKKNKTKVELIKAGKMSNKQIQLPIDVVNDLQKLADLDNRKIKPYMEKVLTDHSKSNKK